MGYFRVQWTILLGYLPLQVKALKVFGNLGTPGSLPLISVLGPVLLLCFPAVQTSHKLHVAILYSIYRGLKWLTMSWLLGLCVDYTVPWSLLRVALLSSGLTCSGPESPEDLLVSSPCLFVWQHARTGISCMDLVPVCSVSRLVIPTISYVLACSSCPLASNLASALPKSAPQEALNETAGTLVVADSLGLQIAQSRHYLCTLDPKAGISYIHGAPGVAWACCCNCVAHVDLSALRLRLNGRVMSFPAISSGL